MANLNTVEKKLDSIIKYQAAIAKSQENIELSNNAIKNKISKQKAPFFKKHGLYIFSALFLVLAWMIQNFMVSDYTDRVTSRSEKTAKYDALTLNVRESKEYVDVLRLLMQYRGIPYGDTSRSILKDALIQNASDIISMLLQGQLMGDAKEALNIKDPFYVDYDRERMVVLNLKYQSLDSVIRYINKWDIVSDAQKNYSDISLLNYQQEVKNKSLYTWMYNIFYGIGILLSFLSSLKKNEA